VEVEIDRGHAVAAEPGKLPDKGKGLLTVVSPVMDPKAASLRTLAALKALQKHLKLDEEGAAQWMAAVRDTRR